MKWHEIKIFRYFLHLFGIKFWRKEDIKKVQKEAEQLFFYFNKEIK